MHKIRAEITKGESVRYLSHLDYAAAMERAVRRAALPAAYSEGFNPHMKLAFASALALGVTSEAEYMDIEFKAPVTASAFCRRMEGALPEGIKIVRAIELPDRQPALMAVVDQADYEAVLPFAGDFAAVERALADFHAAAQVLFLRQSPKRSKEVEIKQYMRAPVTAKSEGGALRFCMSIRITSSGSVKPTEVLQALQEQFAMPTASGGVLICRKGLYAKGKKPIDIVVWRDSV